MQVYKDNSWQTVNKHTTICSMLNEHTNIMDNAYERLKPQLTDKVRNKYDEYILIICIYKIDSIHSTDS